MVDIYHSLIIIYLEHTFMRILVFVLLLLTANCFLDDYWEREVSQEAQEEKGRFGSFINQSHGVVDLYYIMRNGSFMVKIK